MLCYVTIENWSYCIQNSQPGSTSSPKRINLPLHLLQKMQDEVPPNSSSFKPFNFDRRVPKSLKHFSNSFSHYTTAFLELFPFPCKK